MRYFSLYYFSWFGSFGEIRIAIAATSDGMCSEVRSSKCRRTMGIILRQESYAEQRCIQLLLSRKETVICVKNK